MAYGGFNYISVLEIVRDIFRNGIIVFSMALNACFSQSTSLTIQQKCSSHSVSHSPRCTIAPERRRAAKVATSSPVRVLPKSLPESERPPPPPRHWSVPIIGFLIEKALGTYKTPLQRLKLYGPIYTSNYFLESHAYLGDYHSISEVMRNTEVFQSKGSSPALLRMFGENSMIILDGEEHAVVRSAVAPAFAPSVFPLYQKRIVSRARKTWESVFESMKSGENVLLAPVFRRHYLSIVVEMTSGVDMDGELSTRVPALFDKVMIMFFTPKYFPKYNEGMQAREELMEILGDMVRWNLANRAHTIEKLREYGDDVVKLGLKDVARGEVDMLLVSMASSSMSTKPGVTPDSELVESLCNTVLLLWLAGYMTAAATSMSSSFEIGFNDEIREKLISEQEALVKDANGNREVTYEQAATKMPLLDSFLLEVLRFYPAINGMSRKVTQDVEILGRYIPRGSNVFCDFKVAHRNHALYPDANSFIPERFLKREGEPKPPAILTFGAPGSPHYCIGAAFSKILMKTTLGTLLREYHYTLDPEQSRKYSVFPEPSPESGIVLETFERRD